MFPRVKYYFDAAVDAHPLTKGAAGGAGIVSAWVADTVHYIDPIARGIALYGGALVVLLSGACWVLDLRRKWKHRNDPLNNSLPED